MTLRAILYLLMLMLFMTPFASPYSRTSTTSYVQGHISQDTIWTFDGSPYIVTGDVTVEAAAMLSIECGVEVRFDGNFSLVILGRLHAVGNGLSPIAFTSNAFAPLPADWNTIKFVGGDCQFLEMKYCVVTYATTGITIESTEKAVVEKCEIIRNRQSGIAVKGKGNVGIKGNVIESGWDGISVTGDVCSGVTISNNSISSIQNAGISFLSCPASTWTHARIFNLTISNNTVLSHGDGIRLYAHAWYEGWVHDVKITDNTVSCNGEAVSLDSYSEWLSWMYGVAISGNNLYASESGIYLRAYHFGQYHPYESLQSVATIANNIVSANQRGICVLGDVAATLINNSVSYNVYGFYLQWFGHVAHWNDIYCNALYGVYVVEGGAVDAENNYWGDPSGPHHETLNVDGKGDRVNGDETTMDFRPFLSDPIDQINDRPVASLQSDKTQATINQTVTLDASASDDDRLVSKYLFDFGDGDNSGWTTSSVVKHNYAKIGVYQASLVVTDDLGVSSNNTATIAISIVERLPSLIVSLTLDPATAHSEEQVSVGVHVTDGVDIIEAAAIQLLSDKGGTFEPISGYTNSSGGFIAIFVAPHVSQQTDVRITMTASKTGYNIGVDHKYVTVFPSEERFDLILASAIPIVLAVVVSVVLVLRRRGRKRKGEGKRAQVDLRFVAIASHHLGDSPRQM